MSSSPTVPADTRLTTVAQLLAQLAAGNFAIPESDAADPELGEVLQQIHQLAMTIERQHAAIAESEERSAEMLDVMITMAGQDYTKRAHVGDGDTVFDGLAAGLNMLADEFEASQRDRDRLQQEIIQSQAAVIQELSTPIIPISGDILVMPLIGNIDASRAQHVLERLLEGVSENHARTVIMDITGVSVVDTHVANTLVRAAQAVQLLGTQMVLTGIRPEVAQTLVNLGIELRGLITWSTLQMGIAYAMRQIRGADARLALR
jgi:anti-anti-sigma factor